MKVWVDCTAAAHPLVLRPIIERLEARGHEVFVTAREYGQTEGMLERLGIPYTSVGRHGGASTLGKARARGRPLGGAGAADLEAAARPRVAHGSVDLAVVSALFRIPSAQMQDYEFAGLQRRISFRVAKRVLVPDSIPVDRLRRIGARERKLVRYPGPQGGVLPGRLRARPRRPRRARPRPREGRSSSSGRRRRPPPTTPATTSTARRSGAWPGSAERAGGDHPPHRARRRAEARALGAANLIVPERAIDAQSLIAYADLVVSAGGTMNREAVALGTPGLHDLRGRMGGVDEELIADGRLRVLDDPATPRAAQARGAGRRPPPARPGGPRRRRPRGCRGRRLA